MFQLTSHQIDFMETFGYLHFPGLLKDRIAEIDEAFEIQMRRQGGDKHDGRKRFFIAPCINHSEYLCTLLDDSRIHGIATGLLGEHYQYWNSDGNYYAGNTGWHSDIAWPEPFRIYKMVMYLDPVTKDTGALRVIPGSHRFGEGFAETLHERLWGRNEFWGSLKGSEVPSVALETEPGDLIVFNHSTKHSSWGGGNKRRMFSIMFTAQHIGGKALKDYQEILRQQGFTKREIFGIPDGPLLTTATPERLRHLQQLIEHVPDAA